jgi:hypothetical protein
VHVWAITSLLFRKELTGIVSLVKEIPGNNTSEIDSTHCISKAILFSGLKDVDHIGEEVLKP